MGEAPNRESTNRGPPEILHQLPPRSSGHLERPYIGSLLLLFALSFPSRLPPARVRRQTTITPLQPHLMPCVLPLCRHGQRHSNPGYPEDVRRPKSGESRIDRSSGGEAVQTLCSRLRRYPAALAVQWRVRDMPTAHLFETRHRQLMDALAGAVSAGTNSKQRKVKGLALLNVASRRPLLLGRINVPRNPSRQRTLAQGSSPPRHASKLGSVSARIRPSNHTESSEQT